MKQIIILILLSVSGINLFSQENSNLKFIFVPHPRSEDQVNQTIAPGLTKINFLDYDVRLLGGDLTWSAGKDSATLQYCDNMFDLDNPNTLWTFGNHDVQTNHRALIKKFTGRDSYYSYSRNGITFLVLDTELNANSFRNTFIIGPQLEMVNEVCDSISKSGYLILLHHRLMWMINNKYFKDRLTDSIAASTRQMDTTNFYSDIYPLLQKVKNKGIQVLVLGGDKSKINIEYSPEDSITFYAVRLAPDFSDEENNVLILNYSTEKKELISNFTPLTEAITTVKEESSRLLHQFLLYQNYPNPFNPNTTISFSIPEEGYISLKIFDIMGREVETLLSGKLSSGIHSINWNAEDIPSGIYFYCLQTDKSTLTKKLILLK